MPLQRSYSKYDRDRKPRKRYNVIPYLVIALLTLALWFYLHSVPTTLQLTLQP